MQQKNVLVFGDAMLDTYLYGTVSRISPEAPVPVVRVERETQKLGGAANVADNVAALGASVSVAFLLGADREAESMEACFSALGIRCDALLRSKRMHTIKKERIVGNGQQIARLDYHDHYSLTSEDEDMLCAALAPAIAVADIVIISDYDKGTCTPRLCQHIIAACNTLQKPVIVDPKGDNWEKYRNATIITPNMKEINQYCGENIPNTNAAIESHFCDMHSRLGVRYLLITRSEQGMTLIGDNLLTHIAAKQRQVFDVSGAGDTVVSTLAVMLDGSVSNLQEAVDIANTAAGIVVGKPGTAVVTRDELIRELQAASDRSIPSKVYHTNEYSALKEKIRLWRTAGEKIVTTNGCFDILHRGHVKLMHEARALGDRLIVAINSDASVKRLKGNSRPINNEEDRAFVVASMDCVDAVVIFDPQDNADLIPEEDLSALGEKARGAAGEAPMAILRLIRPDIHAKGGDYALSDVPEAIYSSQFVTIPLAEGYSTTASIQNMSSFKEE